MLGRTLLNTSKTSSPILKSLKNTIQKDVNAAISDVAKTLDIHDFYSAHVLDYCEVRRRRSCPILKTVTDVDFAIVIGLFHTVTFHESDLSALQECNFLLQPDIFLPFRPGSRYSKRAQAWRQAYRSEVAICNRRWGTRGEGCYRCHVCSLLHGSSDHWSVTSIGLTWGQSGVAIQCVDKYCNFVGMSSTSPWRSCTN